MLIKITCPGKMVPVRVEPSVTAEVKKHLKDGDEFKAFTLKIAGFYKLADGSGFVNSGTKGIEWTNVPGGVVCIRVSCEGFQVPVRDAPSVSAETKRKLKHGDEFQAFSTLVSGYYQFTDGSGYVNKFTKGVIWEEIAALTKSVSNVKPNSSGKSTATAVAALPESANPVPLQPILAPADTVESQTEASYDTKTLNQISIPIRGLRRQQSSSSAEDSTPNEHEEEEKPAANGTKEIIDIVPPPTGATDTAVATNYVTPTKADADSFAVTDYVPPPTQDIHTVIEATTDFVPPPKADEDTGMTTDFVPPPTADAATEATATVSATAEVPPHLRDFDDEPGFEDDDAGTTLHVPPQLISQESTHPETHENASQLVAAEVVNGDKNDGEINGHDNQQQTEQTLSQQVSQTSPPPSDPPIGEVQTGPPGPPPQKGCVIN